MDQDQSRAFAGILSRFDRDRRHQENRMALGPADLRMLWLLSDERPRTLREISDELHLEQSTVNRQVNAAVGEGLVERSRPPGSPAYLFSRTARGFDAFEADVEVSLGAYREALDALGAEDSATLLRLFAQFTEAYATNVQD